jgi:hypothetical protein
MVIVTAVKAPILVSLDSFIGSYRIIDIVKE